MKKQLKKESVHYLNEDASGFIFVSKRPLSQIYYCTMAKLKCIDTKAKRITSKGVFPGAICCTTHNEIKKITSVKMINGYERSYIKEGTLNH